MRIIDWNENYTECTLVRGYLWWKRYARVERIFDVRVSAIADWRYVATKEHVTTLERGELVIARSRAFTDVSPWQRARPGAVPRMRVITEHTRVDGEVLRPGPTRVPSGGVLSYPYPSKVEGV